MLKRTAKIEILVHFPSTQENDPRNVYDIQARVQFNRIREFRKVKFNLFTFLTNADLLH